MSCAYCDSKSPRKPVMDDEETYVTVEECGLSVDLLISYDLGKSWISKWIPIRHCPMCGAKLVVE